MELHLSKGSHSSRDFLWPPDPASSHRRAHRWLAVLWRFAMLGQHWLRDFCTTLQLCNIDLPRLSSLYIYTYVYLYMYIYTCILITTAPTSLGLKTVGEVLPQKTYRPRIKWGREKGKHRWLRQRWHPYDQCNDEQSLHIYILDTFTDVEMWWCGLVCLQAEAPKWAIMLRRRTAGNCQASECLMGH